MCLMAGAFSAMVLEAVDHVSKTCLIERSFYAQAFKHVRFYRCRFPLSQRLCAVVEDVVISVEECQLDVLRRSLSTMK